MSEQSEARRDGADLQPNSGRGTHKKADATLGDLSIDYKEYGQTFGISRKAWAKVCTDAATNGPDMVPVIKVVLGQGMAKTRLAVIGWEYLEHLKQIEQLYNEQETA